MAPRKVETIRRSYNALSRGDLRPMRELVTDDVEWETSGSLPGMQSAYYGKAGIDEWMHLLRSVWSSYDMSLDEVVGETDYALIVIERVGDWDQEAGAEAGIPAFAVYWFDAARVRRRRSFTSREEALEAAGLRE